MPVFGGSTRLRVFVDVSHCCGLEIEQLSLPRYRYFLHNNIEFVSEPAKASLMIVGGDLSSDRVTSLQRSHERLQAPKLVFAFGNCPTFQGLRQSEGVLLSEVLPVSSYISGCAPSAMSLIQHLNDKYIELFELNNDESEAGPVGKLKGNRGLSSSLQ